MKIAIGSDHAAYDMRLLVADYVRELGHEVTDYGPETKERTDYPIYGATVAHAVVNGDADLGIAICGSGIGISIAANKVKGARAACCSEPYSARMSRQHNNANVICFGARVIGPDMAKMIVDEFLTATYEGDRHQRRVDQLAALDDGEYIGC